MHNTLPISRARRDESGIVNLNDARGPGTLWVAYAMRDNNVIYFDSFGNLRPPKKLMRYFGNGVTKIEYNRTPYQTYNQSICGQLCLQFLRTSMCANLKPDSALFNSLFVGRFFNHVADTYANREDQRSRYNLLSSHRFK